MGSAHTETNKESPRDRNELHSVSSAGYLITIKVEYNRKTVNLFSLHCLHKMGCRKRWQTEWDTSLKLGQIWCVCVCIKSYLTVLSEFIFFSGVKCCILDDYTTIVVNENKQKKKNKKIIDRFLR